MVIILRGCSGSGKSKLADFLKSGGGPELADTISILPSYFYAAKLRDFISNTEHRSSIVSADDYFMVKGEYKFDPRHLTTAHQACLREFAKLVQADHSVVKNVIIVDNTHCSVNEVVTYANLASAFAHEVQIITLLTDPKIAWKRNQHNVPFATVVRQAYNLQVSIGEWPSWLPHQQVFPE